MAEVVPLSLLRLDQIPRKAFLWTGVKYNGVRLRYDRVDQFLEYIPQSPVPVHNGIRIGGMRPSNRRYGPSHVIAIRAESSLRPAVESARGFSNLAKKVNDTVQKRLAGLAAFAEEVKELDSREYRGWDDSDFLPLLGRNSDEITFFARIFGSDQEEAVSTVVLDVMTDLCKCKTAADLRAFIRRYKSQPISAPVSPSDARLAYGDRGVFFKRVIHLLHQDKLAEAVSTIGTHQTTPIGSARLRALVEAGLNIYRVILDDLLGDQGFASIVAAIAKPLEYYFEDATVWSKDNVRTTVVQTGYVKTYYALVEQNLIEPISGFSERMTCCLNNAYLHFYRGHDEWRPNTVSWLMVQKTFYADAFLKDHLRRCPRSFAKDLLDWATSTRDPLSVDRHSLETDGMLVSLHTIVEYEKMEDDEDRAIHLTVQDDFSYRHNGSWYWKYWYDDYRKLVTNAFAPVVKYIDNIITYWSKTDVKEKLAVQKWLFQTVLGRVGGTKPTVKEFREKWEEFPILSYTRKKQARNDFAKKWITRLYEPTRIILRVK